MFRPAVGERLSVQPTPGARDLLRHAFADVGGNGNRARSWAKFARRWPPGPQRHLLDAYPRHRHAGAAAVGHRGPRPSARWPPRRRSICIPDAQLRTLPGTGFLMAYDDPVGVARELIAFCG